MPNPSRFLSMYPCQALISRTPKNSLRSQYAITRVKGIQQRRKI
ncbi:hypothetical protein RintRC_2696 [Richelia intracellularis]|nr:hypothetical protein RintRC_2696 [Richelia intracellularis]